MNKHILVLGAGVSGLTSAIVLADAGYDVEIWTKDLTLDTTSAAAGAFWEPYRCNPIERALPWSKVTFDYLRDHVLSQADSGVREIWAEAYSTGELQEPWWRPAVEIFEPLAGPFPDMYRSGYHFKTFLIDSSHYLPWLVEQARARNIPVTLRAVTNFEEAFAVGFEMIVNCTGLGSRELCQDDRLFPIRGQVVRVARGEVNEVKVYINQDDAALFVPRFDDMIVGATAQENDWNTAVDPADTVAILERATNVLPELKGLEMLGAKVGLRPGRDEIRLEVEHSAAGPIVHNYGHGGAGYTLSWGCAQEVVELVKSLS